ncbi:unnamed protein product, partial [Urochloa humidicola]
AALSPPALLRRRPSPLSLSLSLSVCLYRSSPSPPLPALRRRPAHYFVVAAVPTRGIQIWCERRLHRRPRFGRGVCDARWRFGRQQCGRWAPGSTSCLGLWRVTARPACSTRSRSSTKVTLPPRWKSLARSPLRSSSGSTPSCWPRRATSRCSLSWRTAGRWTSSGATAAHSRSRRSWLQMPQPSAASVAPCLRRQG